MQKAVVLFLSMGISMIFISVVLKMVHWQNSGLLLMAGLVVQFCALVSFIILRIQQWHEYPVRKAAILSLTLGGTLVLTGAAFHLVHWQGAHVLIYLGIVIEFFSVLTYLISRKPNV